MVTTPRAPARGPRLAGAVAAGALLAGLLVGLPVALALLAGNPLPAGMPSTGRVWTALVSFDDGTLFLRMLSAVGWLAWLGFAGSVLLEVVGRLTGRRPPSIPGLRGPQRLAAGLVAAVAAVAVSPTLASGDAAPVDAPPPAPAAAAPTAPTATTPAGVPTSAALVAAPTGAAPARVPALATQSVGGAVHLVGRGEGLLDLQDRYGVPWQRIAEANYGVRQADGRSLQRGQQRIYAGWQLHIPERVAATVTAHEYEVAEGDWMWHIADRHLGDPERFRDIAALNQRYAQRHGDFPDHIQPGWVLRLPADADDRGPTTHASGTTRPVLPDGTAQQPEPVPREVTPQPATPEPEAAPRAATPQAADPPAFADPPEVPAAVATPPPPTASTPAEPPPPASTPAAPDRPTGPVPVHARPVDDTDVQPPGPTTPEPERLAPAALASAGLLAALVLGAVTYHRQRRNQARPADAVTTTVATRRLDRTLRIAQQPLDAQRLDAALRALAAGLAGPTRSLPDIAGAVVTEGSVELLLERPCPEAPAPWQAYDRRWLLPAGAALPAVHGLLAPLPTLATVGSQPGHHVLLDLERLGVLGVHGDPQRSTDLLRYLAAELARNTWSDTAEVLLAGFPPADVDRLVELRPDRVRELPSVGEGIALLRQRVAAARATLEHTGLADALAGRLRGVVGDAWMPRVLLAATATGSDLAALAELRRELDAAGRCGVAVVVAVEGRLHARGWRVTVNASGVLHLRLPFLHTSLSAAALPAPELAALAGSLRQARVAAPLPRPPAVEPEAWAAGTDTAGGVLADIEPDETWSVRSVPAPDRRPDPQLPQAVAPHAVAPHADAPQEEVPQGEALPEEAPAEREWTPEQQPPPAAPRRYADPDLDGDLYAWHADDPGRPRVGVLGPVRVDAPGPAPEQRRLLHTELVVYLAQQGSRGADSSTIDAALWPDGGIQDSTRQVIISRARRWLGTDPGGNPWLCDVDADLTYRLAEGFLLDWHLFRRLRTRGEQRGDRGGADLRAALRLVRGAPLDGADRPASPASRNPYSWLPDSQINPDDLVAAVVDTAHQLAELCLAGGDTDGVRWAVQQAWAADAARSYDQPWRDLMRAEHADGQLDRARAVLAELMDVRDAEVPEDLAPDTYELVRDWLPTFTGTT